MADTRSGKVTACNESCGCPSPCPGGTDCRCSSSGADMEHKQCSCGEHCGCNPCTCDKETAAATTKGCRCGPACTCATCAAA